MIIQIHSKLLSHIIHVTLSAHITARCGGIAWPSDWWPVFGLSHILWHRCELAARRPQREPGGVAQESHLSQFLRLEGTAGERMDARANL